MNACNGLLNKLFFPKPSKIPSRDCSFSRFFGKQIFKNHLMFQPLLFALDDDAAFDDLVITPKRALTWFAETALSGAKALTRAGLAHLWFESIHFAGR
jgi:hypothetical protein